MRNLVKEMGREIMEIRVKNGESYFLVSAKRLFSRIEVKIGRCPCGCL